MSLIAVFDSGVGGLSIYQEIVKQCPDHNYVFISDNLAFPYGTKNEDDLIGRVLTVIDQVDKQYHPDLLVVACNTASTLALPALRQQFKFPIVGVVPAIKPAAKITKSKVIGLLATPGTIARSYTQDLIEEFAFDCDVIKVGSSPLVEIAEQKLSEGKPSLKQIEQELEPFFKNKRLDCLVLACTHFPLLNKEIEQIFKAKNHSVDLIDSGLAIANRVAELCANSKDKTDNFNTAVFTKLLESSSLKTHLQNLGFNNIDLLD